MTAAPVVVDAYALLAWLNEEPEYRAYSRYLEGFSWRRLITPITLFEIKLALLKKGVRREEQVAIIAHILAACEIQSVTDAIALRAAEIRYKYLLQDAKSKTKANVSMADAIAVSLAEAFSAPLLSGDRGLRQVNEVKQLP